MRYFKQLAVIGGISFFLLSMVGCGGSSSGGASSSSSDKTYQLSLASQVAEHDNDRHTIKLRAFKEEVESRTSGKVTIRLHYAAELGSEREYVEMLQTGDLPLATMASSVMAGFTDVCKFLEIPMLFESEDQLFKFTRSDFAYKRLEGLEKIGIIGLGVSPAGSRNLLTVPSKPVKRLADLKGLKIRVMETPIHIEAMGLLGAQPTPMPYPECYQSMQTGVIDGMENEVTTYIAMRFYEVAPNYSQINWLMLAHLFVGSKGELEKLPADYQTIIKEAGRKAADKSAEVGIAYDKVHGRAAATEKGANIIDVDVNEFRKVLAPMLVKHKDLIGQDVIDWIAAN